jgi:hypothetical protein
MQLLVYTVVNDDMATPSYTGNADAKPLNKPMMAWFFKHYGADPANPYALPMKAQPLQGLPQATVIGAGIDPLLSEGKLYADRFKKDGLKVSYQEFKGVTHEFFGMGAVVPRAKEAGEYAADAIGKAVQVEVMFKRRELAFERNTTGCSLEGPPLPGPERAAKAMTWSTCARWGDLAQAGSVAAASPASMKAWQRQPPRSRAFSSQLRHGSCIQLSPR